jgi:site-specific DNA recombinase
MSQAIRCAIYTRKSTEEGLDQQFNSLDAQREACEAYIASQRHEGWKALPKRYDDGGYSGGNTQRPGLQALLTDIATGKVDLVVVYKIDRLTRSLADFAKMVEVFDKHRTSFVSITQHFNTTSSMGRLTLNVLLSFAQFEREVTGERIRDKIAASKKKGLWMGGSVPLGYDVKDKALMVNPKEAAQVRQIFQRYLVLGSVSLLKEELDAKGMTSKPRVDRNGKQWGGASFSRGALYWLLQNRYYLGEVTHAGKSYLGVHKAIVSKDLWDQVQESLSTNRRQARRREQARSPSLLAGRVMLPDGTRLTPSHTNKQGKRYRYYKVGYPKEGEPKPTGKKISVPAHDLEMLVEREWKLLLTSKPVQDRLAAEPEARADAIKHLRNLANAWDGISLADRMHHLQQAHAEVRVYEDKVVLSAHPEPIATRCLHPLGDGGKKPKSPPITRMILASVHLLHGEKKILTTSDDTLEGNRVVKKDQLLRRIALGRAWASELIEGKVESPKGLAQREKKSESFVYDVLRAGCLSPRVVEHLINELGATVHLDDLMAPMPVSWMEQARLVNRS